MQRAAGEVVALGEEHRTFPAAARAEVRTLGLQAQVRRGHLRGTTGRTLFRRIADAVLVLVGLDGLRGGELDVRVLEIAARVERPHVPLGRAVRDPLGDQFAGTTRLGNAKSKRAAVIKARQARRRPHQRIAVGRVGNRPIDDRLHVDRAQDRHSLASRLDVSLQPPGIIVERDSRQIRAMKSALQTAYGKEPIFQRVGGGIGVDPVRPARGRQIHRAGLQGGGTGKITRVLPLRPALQ